MSRSQAKFLPRHMGLWPVRGALARWARAGGPCHGGARTLLLALFAFTLLGADRATAPATASIHFQSVDLFVDPHGAPLAAYQLEFTSESENVKLVGVEGGENPAFKEPPYYDPRVMMHNRVILAALNAGDNLPTARTRVARLHLEITGEHPDFETHLIVAASSDGSHIAADVSVSEGEKP